MSITTIRFDNRSPDPQFVKIGNEGEDRAERVRFILPYELQGRPAMLFIAKEGKGDGIPLEHDHTWIPGADCLVEPGKWDAYIEVPLDNGGTWNSDPFSLKVGDLPGAKEAMEKLYPTALEVAIKTAGKIINAKVSAATLEAGSEATAEMTEDAEGNVVIKYGIPKGTNGKTPVKGTDYWTADDIAQIKSYVDDAILNGEW